MPTGYYVREASSVGDREPYVLPDPLRAMEPPAQIRLPAVLLGVRRLHRRIEVMMYPPVPTLVRPL